MSKLLWWALSMVLWSGASSAAQVQLRVLETTDLHMNLLDYDYYQDAPTDQYGLARTATLIKAARAEAPNTLLFDNGDLLQGTPLGDLVAKVQPLKAGQVHPAYKVMNLLGYDAANLGNHDFNYGLPFLRQALTGAAFPYVNANVYLDDAARSGRDAHHAFTPYLLLDRELTDATGGKHPIRIGVIGFVPPQIMQWDKGNLEGRVVVRDIAETARELVPEMRSRGAQLVIAIPHSGLERTWDGKLAENEVGQLALVPGIDAILFGHAHAEFPGPDFAGRPNVDVARGTINGVPAVMPGRWGDHLGLIDLTLEVSATGQWQVLEGRSSIRAVRDRQTQQSLAAADPMVEAAIADEHRRTLAYVRARVAQSAAPIYSYFAQVVDDPSVQIVADAQLAYAKRALQGTAYEKLPLLSAAAPFKTGGRQGWRSYTDIPAGPLAIKNVADLYVYPNTVKAVLLDGAQVREWLEMSAGQFRRIDPKGPPRQPLLDNRPSYNFDTLDGVQYEFDLTQPARYDARGTLVEPGAHRVQALTYRGQPVAPEAKFIVVTNNYRAYGGGNFPGLNGANVVLDSPDETRQVVIDYLATFEGPIDPTADRNWHVRPVPGVTMTFRSGSGGIPYLGRQRGIRLERDNGDGSADYDLVD